MKTEQLLISIFVAVESAHAFSAFNPSIFTIHRFRDQYTYEDIKKGCILASGFSLVIGGVASGIIHNYVPLAMAAATAALMSAAYLAAVKGII